MQRIVCRDCNLPAGGFQITRQGDNGRTVRTGLAVLCMYLRHPSVEGEALGTVIDHEAVRSRSEQVGESER